MYEHVDAVVTWELACVWTQNPFRRATDTPSLRFFALLAAWTTEVRSEARPNPPGLEKRHLDSPDTH